MADGYGYACGCHFQEVHGGGRCARHAASGIPWNEIHKDQAVQPALTDEMIEAEAASRNSITSLEHVERSVFIAGAKFARDHTGIPTLPSEEQIAAVLFKAYHDSTSNDIRVMDAEASRAVLALLRGEVK